MEASPHTQRIRVYWPTMRRFYAGRVFMDDKKRGIYRIHYDDGEVHYIKLAEFRWEFEKPRNPKTQNSKKEGVTSPLVTVPTTQKRQKTHPINTEARTAADAEQRRSDKKPWGSKRMRLVSELMPASEELQRSQAKRQNQPSRLVKEAATGNTDEDRQRQLRLKKETCSDIKLQVSDPKTVVDLPASEAQTGRKKPQRIVLPFGSDGSGGTDALPTPLGPCTPAAEVTVGLNARSMRRHTRSLRITACRKRRSRLASSSLLCKPAEIKGLKAATTHTLPIQPPPGELPEAGGGPVGGRPAGEGTKVEAGGKRGQPIVSNKQGGTSKVNVNLGRKSGRPVAGEQGETGRLGGGKRKQWLCRRESVLRLLTGVANNHAEAEAGALQWGPSPVTPGGEVMSHSSELLREKEKAGTGTAEMGEMGGKGAGGRGSGKQTVGQWVKESSRFSAEQPKYVKPVEGGEMGNIGLTEPPVPSEWTHVAGAKRSSLCLGAIGRFSEGGCGAKSWSHGSGMEEMGGWSVEKGRLMQGQWVSWSETGLVDPQEDDNVSWDGVEEASEWSEMLSDGAFVNGWSTVSAMEVDEGESMYLEDDRDACDTEILSLASVLVKLQEGGRSQ